ncbi:pseudouridine synthase [Rubritalea tangerina]|uniref:Pseudouridine synthase n=1 Tax=Rubritalea tangerina TaxID=430798 RepID=A0ABW4ZBK2_9BACT
MIIALNKPYGVLSQFNRNPDYPEQRTLGDVGVPPECLPVGRLDMDSEGLLLLTDEKGLEAKLMDPEMGHRRRYWVQVDGSPNQEVIQLIRSGGLNIRGHLTRKCRAQLLDAAPKLPERVPAVDGAADGRSQWLELELREGKNRQVRRMTAKVGFPTLRLWRQSIGDFELSDLAPGEWRVLSEFERSQLFRV